MFATFNATFNIATRTEAAPAPTQPVSGSGSGSTSASAAPAMRDAGRGARLAYRLVSAIGSMGR